MRPAYLIVLEILLDSMTVPTLKMQVSRALQVYYIGCLQSSHSNIINPECLARMPQKVTRSEFL